MLFYARHVTSFISKHFLFAFINSVITTERKRNRSSFKFITTFQYGNFTMKIYLRAHWIIQFSISVRSLHIYFRINEMSENGKCWKSVLCFCLKRIEILATSTASRDIVLHCVGKKTISLLSLAPSTKKTISSLLFRFWYKMFSKFLANLLTKQLLPTESFRKIKEEIVPPVVFRFIVSRMCGCCL